MQFGDLRFLLLVVVLEEPEYLLLDLLVLETLCEQTRHELLDLVIGHGIHGAHILSGSSGVGHSHHSEIKYVPLPRSIHGCLSYEWAGDIHRWLI